MNKILNFIETATIMTVSVYKMITAVLMKPILTIPVFFSLIISGAYYIDYKPFIEALVVCIFADSVFGVWLSIKEKRFELSKSVAIVQKIVVYGFYLLIVHYISKLDWIIEFDITIMYITKFVFTAMILTEGKSAVQNGNILFPNKIAGTIVWFFDKIDGRMNDKVNKDTNK